MLSTHINHASQFTTDGKRPPFRRALYAGAVAAVLASLPAYAAPPLLLTFENDTGRSNASVYIGFLGGNTTTLSATNVATGEPIQLTTFGNEHWYYLNALPSGINLTSFDGGRIYVGFGTPWHLLRAGYVPNPTNPADPDYLKRYDKMEMTYTAAPADVADTTSIDFFSIPMALNVYQGGTSGTLVGSVTASAANTIIAALGKITSPPKAAVVRNPAGHAFVRVIGPGTYPPPPQAPASPYNDLNGYLTYLQAQYAPAHGGVAATIAGHFAGVGAGSSPQTQPQDYDFTATIDSGLNITLTGSGTVIGHHTMLLSNADLTVPSGIYGANPMFSLDGGMPTAPQNDIYGWMIGDLLAGLNVGAAGSTVTANGIVVGEMASQDWFNLTSFFAALQPGHKNFYNRWAAAMAPLSQAYNFAYSDRFAHVVVPLDPARVDTLQIVFLNDKPSASVSRAVP